MESTQASSAPETPQYFRWKDCHLYTHGAPWAAWFFAGQQTHRCTKCARVVRYTSGPAEATIDKGLAWMDVIGVGGSYPEFMVSERVVETLMREGIKSFTAHPVAVKVTATKLIGKAHPDYYWLMCDPGLRCDEEKSGVRLPPLACDGCGLRQRPATLSEGRSPRMIVPLIGSWKGFDLFEFDLQAVSGAVFCTRRIIGLARREQWTGCRFLPIDAAQDDMGGWTGIDYLGKKWPPDWYPSPHDIPGAGGWKITDDGRKELFAFAFQRIRPDGTLETLWERPPEIVGRD